jgi:hypothetical protein
MDEVKSGKNLQDNPSMLNYNLKKICYCQYSVFQLVIFRYKTTAVKIVGCLCFK